MLSRSERPDSKPTEHSHLLQIEPTQHYADLEVSCPRAGHQVATGGVVTARPTTGQASIAPTDDDDSDDEMTSSHLSDTGDQSTEKGSKSGSHPLWSMFILGLAGGLMSGFEAWTFEITTM